MLDMEELDYIIRLLKAGEPLPEDYQYKLFPVQHKEYELAYAGKMRKEDLLANEDGSFPVPLQLEKQYGSTSDEEHAQPWRNLIVLGDNLQFLKTLYENRDPVIKDQVKGKVKLIYIDPPFATSDEFQSKEGAKAYQDKKKGAEFVEYLRRRLLIAKEILADDGSIFVHLDWKMAHYIKIVLDEIFGKNNLRNEIIWTYHGPGSPGMRQFNRKHDTIFGYTKSSTRWTFHDREIRVAHDAKTLDNFRHGLEGSGFIGEPYELNEEGKVPEDWWQMAIASRIKIDGVNRTGYPTEKPYKLIERILRACTGEGDLVLDFFGGSGVLAAVAEQLGRRWITCDIGKLSHLMTQKRILQIAHAKNLKNPNQTYGKAPAPFATYVLGSYDLKATLEMEWDKYKTFLAGLFDFSIQSFAIGGYPFDGKKEGCPVKIFDYHNFPDSNVDALFLEDISRYIDRQMSGGTVYIVAPSIRVDFITDYQDIDGIRYYFLKIPYRMVKELHPKPFQKYRQPQSKSHVNTLDEAVGFSFNRTPVVESTLYKKASSLFCASTAFPLRS